MTFTKGKHILKQNGRAGIPKDAKKLPGFQLRYIYFIDKTAKYRLTVPILPFSEIDKRGAGMYKGKSKPRASSETSDTADNQSDKGGATPTDALH